MTRKPLTIFTAVFGAVGAILLCVTAFLATSTISFARTADHATGEVIGHVKRMSCSNSTTRSTRSCSEVWAPTVTFTTGDGQQVTFTDSVAGSPPSHDVGESVDVGYRGPHDARIFSFWRLAFPSFITGGLGLVFGGVAVLLFVWLRRMPA